MVIGHLINKNIELILKYIIYFHNKLFFKQINFI